MSTNDPRTPREWLAYGIEQVKAGRALKRWSPDTITVGGRCAQLQRETVEGCLGLDENTWPVATKAHEFRKARGGVDRWAADYEQAARALGLTKTIAQIKIGDILYWPYTAYVTIKGKRTPQAFGHTVMYAGLIGGVPHVMENSDWSPARRQQQGAILPLGAGAHVYLTPLKLFAEPTTIIAPTRELWLEDQAVLTPAKPVTTGSGRVIPANWYPTRDAATKAPTGRYVSIQMDGTTPVVFEVPADRLKELK